MTYSAIVRAHIMTTYMTLSHDRCVLFSRLLVLLSFPHKSRAAAHAGLDSLARILDRDGIRCSAVTRLARQSLAWGCSTAPTWPATSHVLYFLLRTYDLVSAAGFGC